MSAIQFGCQFYTWQMSGERYIGKLPHILQVINSAGFAGIEPETCMLGHYYNDPLALKELLVQYGLKLGALTLVLDWRGAVETNKERQEAERLFEYMKPFPGTHLVLCQMPGKDRTDLRQRQISAIACVNAVAARAADRGIACSFHPNSPPGSIFRLEDDYNWLLDGLDSRLVGFAPDSGHIANGGMDVIQVFQTYLPLIKHVHFKDITAAGGWTAMGAGVIDFPPIVTMLADSGYTGWIMVEEESPEAEINPDGATNQNGKHLHRVLLPLIQDRSNLVIRSTGDDLGVSTPVRYEKIDYPDPGQVRIYGRLSSRFLGNIRYLKYIFEKKKDWMLEPFQRRGQEWVIEPRRNQKGELPWAGEYAGKWLDAASLAAASSDDNPLSQYSSEFASALIATQEKDGYLGIEVPEKRGENSEWDLWNVKYAMTGLLTHYEVFREQTSLDAAKFCAEWLINRYGMLAGADSPFFQSPEDGGVSATILDDLVRLVRLTGEVKFLQFASSVTAHFPPVIKMQETCQAPLVHAYTLLGYLGGVIEQLAAGNASDELHWIEQVWEDLVDRHLYPTGSLGYNELLRMSAPNDTPVENGLPARHHQETCATVEWLLFNSRLYQATGNVRYMEKMEQTIYNALQAAQSTDGMSWMYYTPLRYEKRWFSGPTSCCYWSGPRGIARLPEWVFALDGTGLRVNLFESSEANVHLHGHALTICQSSLYPEEGRVTLQVQPDEPFSFTLLLRKPFQDDKIRIRLNGHAIAAQPTAHGYYPIQRQWCRDDQIEMEFDIPVTVQHFLSDSYGILTRGAQILAVNQVDNAALDLDQLELRNDIYLNEIDAVAGKRQYTAEIYTGGVPTRVVFTPYADCGEHGSRFRTAFPIH